MKAATAIIICALACFGCGSRFEAALDGVYKYDHQATVEDLRLRGLDTASEAGWGESDVLWVVFTNGVVVSMDGKWPARVSPVQVESAGTNVFVLRFRSADMPDVQVEVIPDGLWMSTSSTSARAMYRRVHGADDVLTAAESARKAEGARARAMRGIKEFINPPKCYRVPASGEPQTVGQGAEGDAVNRAP